MTTTHGHASGGKCTSEYRSWTNMIQRCYNPSSNRYYIYGARGITVCERWRQSFPMFLEDMGLKPSPSHSVERINNNGDYEPGNCKWATREEQGTNKRNNRLVTINGVTKAASQWARDAGLGRWIVHRRLRDGKSGADAVKPVERVRINGEFTVCRTGLHSSEWRRVDSRGIRFCLLCRRMRDARHRERKRRQLEGERR